MGYLNTANKRRTNLKNLATELKLQRISSAPHITRDTWVTARERMSLQSITHGALSNRRVFMIAPIIYIFAPMRVEEKNEIKNSAYAEALRYIDNAKENLHKAKKHGKY